MSVLSEIGELTPVRSRTIVINVATDLVAARAVLSATHVTDDPVLLINCSPTSESRLAFERLARHVDFDVLEAPAELHGTTLDWVFRSLEDERILLLDSDAELRDGEYVRSLHGALDHPLAFGAGFTWGPFYIPEDWKAPSH